MVFFLSSLSPPSSHVHYFAMFCKKDNQTLKEDEGEQI